MQKKPTTSAFIDAAPDAKTPAAKGGRPPRGRGSRAVVTLTSAQGERVAAMAANLGISKNAVISLAVAAYLDARE